MIYDIILGVIAKIGSTILIPIADQIIHYGQRYNAGLRLATLLLDGGL
jgi:hypothetical protein